MPVQPDVAVGDVPGSSGDAARARPPENRRERLRRLRWRARGFAVAVALISVFPLMFGFGLSMVWLVPLSVALTVFLWPINIWAVERMADSPSFTTPKARVALTIAGALIVALAATLWCFHDEIEAELASADPAAWSAKVQSLRDEQSELTKKTGPVPLVERDPEVVRLEQELDQLNGRLYEADQYVLCEFDGTCGTRVPGDGPQYRERVKYRDQLKGQVDELSGRLDNMKAELRAQIHQLADEKGRAEKDLAEREKQLTSLGTAPPVPKGRVDALFTASKEHAMRAAAASAVAFLVFLSIDWLLLLIVVRRICRRDVEVPVADEFYQRQLEDLASIRTKRRAMSYSDYAQSEARNEPSTSEQGDSR